MNSVPSIDLHPEHVRGTGPEAALMACRDFLDRSLRAGHREVRIITGLGTRGDGTPRLRTRVEQDVLGSYFSSIESQAYEQGGAVIHLWLRPRAVAPTAAYKRHQRHQAERQDTAGREERLLVAYDRLDAAEKAFEEGDWRRCRLKLNQVAKEFGFPSALADLDEATAGDLLDRHWAALRKLDQGT
jgi:hypothetical protein